MEKSNSYSDIHPFILITTFVIPMLAQASFFIFQVVNGIISIWNTFATGLLIAIFVNAIRIEIKHYKHRNDPTPTFEVTGGSTIEPTSKPKKKIKTMLIFISIALISASLSAVFYNQYNKRTKDLSIVTAQVISQSGDRSFTTEETDDGLEITEKESISVKIKYTFNNTEQIALLSGNTTSKIYVDEIKIYVDNTGKCISDIGRIDIWKVESIIFLSFGILMLISAFLGTDIIFIAGSIFTCLGSAFLALIGCQFIENILFNDLIGFMTVFINIGIYFFIFWFLLLFLADEKSLSKTNISTPKQIKTSSK